MTCVQFCYVFSNNSGRCSVTHLMQWVGCICLYENFVTDIFCKIKVCMVIPRNIFFTKCYVFSSFKSHYSNIYFGNKNAEEFSKSKNYVSALSNDAFSLDTPNLVPTKGQDYLYLSTDVFSFALNNIVQAKHVQW